MIEHAIGDNISEPVQTCPEKYPWFNSIINTLKRYKSELFGAGDSEMKKQRARDYTVQPTIKFVLAKYSDGYFRPGCIAGRSKKRQLFAVQFYHTKKCLYVKPTDVIMKHGNLLNAKVSFTQHGKELMGKVYGNNSPANKGFPSTFFIKNNNCWHKISFKMIFLTKKQLTKFKHDIIKSGKSRYKCAEDVDASMMECDLTTLQESDKDMQELDADFEMS